MNTMTTDATRLDEIKAAVKRLLDRLPASQALVLTKTIQDNDESAGYEESQLERQLLAILEMYGEDLP
jgi:hypothetical protein